MFYCYVIARTAWLGGDGHPKLEIQTGYGPSLA